MHSILIVDDEPMIRKGLISQIPWVDAGVTQVMDAASGEQALAIMADIEPDVLITDINMREMTGLELIERVNAQYPRVDVIVLTGHDDFEYARSCLRMHVRDFLLKPIDEDQLLELVKKLISERDSGIDATQEPPDDEYAGIVERAKRLIAEQLAQDVTVSSLAQQLFISPAYLSRLFKRAESEGCNEYITRNRIERAKALLVSTEMRIFEVANAVGYRDHNYFSLAFKKHTGLSPVTYRESHRAQS